MLITITRAGNPENELTVSTGASLQSVLNDQNISMGGSSVSVNGRPLTENQISSYTLNEGDAVYISRETKLG